MPPLGCGIPVVAPAAAPCPAVATGDGPWGASGRLAAPKSGNGVQTARFLPDRISRRPRHWAFPPQTAHRT